MASARLPGSNHRPEASATSSPTERPRPVYLSPSSGPWVYGSDPTWSLTPYFYKIEEPGFQKEAPPNPHNRVCVQMHCSSIYVSYVTFHRLVCDMGDSLGLWHGVWVLLGSYCFMVPELNRSQSSRTSPSTESDQQEGHKQPGA